MLKYFTVEDPDGNGQKDTVGMVASSEVDWFNNFTASFGLGASWTKNADGEYDVTALSDNYKDMCNYFANLYKNGYLYGDFHKLSDAEKLEKFTSGKCGVMLAQNASMVDHIVNQMANSALLGKLTTEDAYLKYIDVIEMPSGTDHEGAYWGDNWYWGGFSVSYDVEEPMRLVRILDYLMSEEGQKLRMFGIEGIHYDMEGDTVVPNLVERSREGTRFQITDLEKGEETGKYVIGVYFSENRFTVDENNDLSVIYDTDVYKNKALINKAYKIIADDELNYEPNALMIDYSEKYYESFVSVKDEMKTMFIKIVTGESDYNTEINAFKSRIGELGYDAMKTEYNQKLK